MTGSEQQCGTGQPTSAVLKQFQVFHLVCFLIFFLWEVERVVIAEPRTTRGKDQGSTNPNLPSFLSAFSTPRLLWRRGRWGSRCHRANTSTLFTFSPGRPLLSAQLLFSPPHSPPAAPPNPLCPSEDLREHNLYKAQPQSLTCIKWAVIILNNFCCKHTLLNRAQFSKASDVLVI